MAVAVGWSGYFVQLCGSLFHLRFPLWLVNDYPTATTLVAKGGDALTNFSSATLPVIAGHTISFNLPAFVIVAAVTILLIYGIRESAKTNTIIVLIKVAVVIFVISFGSFMVNPGHWHPYAPNGFAGVMSGAAIVFFAFIGFDAVSTTAEETRNPQRDMPIGIITSQITCTILYVLMSTVLTGMKKYTVYAGDAAAVATAFGGTRWAQALVSARTCRNDLSPARVPTRTTPYLQWLWRATDCCRHTLRASTRVFVRSHHHDMDRCSGRRVAMITDIGSLADLTNIGTLFAFILVCIGVVTCREAPEPSTPVPRPPRSGLSDCWCAVVYRADAEPTRADLDTVHRLASDRDGDLLRLRRAQ